MKKKKINKNENEWKGILQETQSNISTESVTSTNINNEVVGKINLKESDFNNVLDGDTTNKIRPFNWGFVGSYYDIDKEHCNLGVNKDWSNEKWIETLTKLCDEQEEKFDVYKSKPIIKEKRIKFKFTPFTFWQLTPSVAINLSMKEVEFVWLCFGMYINWK